MNWADALTFFKGEHYDRVMERILQDEERGHAVLPPFKKIFRALELTPLESVKVLILGQDPYPDSGHANGLAFSVYPDVSPTPKTLKNIYKEMEADIGECPTNGDLTPWAEQGVLLLNTSLTVIEGARSSHSKIGWKPLVEEIISLMGEIGGMVFVLWGVPANKFASLINEEQNYIISSTHPSPLSANKKNTSLVPFMGSKPFSRVNECLQSESKPKICWAGLNSTETQQNDNRYRST